MRVGVIGVGNMGRNHPRVYRELGIELIGVADIDIKQAEEIAGQQGTKAFADYRELLDLKPDAVSVVVPTSKHNEVALEVIDRGINLLIEKPIADSLSTAREIVMAAESRGVKLVIGHIERYNPVVQKLKQMVDDNVLGKLVMLAARRVGPFVPRISDVGIIVDVATHDIDVIRYLVGNECSSVFARSTRLKNLKGDAAIILMAFDDITAFVEVNWYTPYRLRTLTITGTEGAVTADYQKQEIELDNFEGRTILKLNYHEPLKKELAHFLDCVENDKQPLTSGNDAIKVLEIALKAEES